MDETTTRIARLAAQQHGCWSRAQALAAGRPRSTQHDRITAGEEAEVLPGVVRAASTPVTWPLRAQAALLWAGGDAVLARWSAARACDLRLPRRGAHAAPGSPVHLLVGHRTFRSVPPGVVVHRSQLSPSSTSTMVRDGLSCTSQTRTVCELAGELGPTALRRLVGHAVRTGATDAVRLRAAMPALGRFRGKRALRHLVDELSPLDADCREELESLFLRRMRERRLEPTAMNHPVVDASGTRRFLDAVYLPEHLPIELDSRSEHGTLLDWHDDLRRENLVHLAGSWRPFLRFSWPDVHDRPDDVAAQLRQALRTAREAHPAGPVDCAHCREIS